jgi:hypothetical protein
MATSYYFPHCSGIFPTSFAVSDDTVVGETAVVAYDYVPAKEKKDHLALSKGESISILSKVSSEWWKGSNGKV